MDTWSSILDFCRTWRREIIRYGVVFLLAASAFSTDRWTVGCLVLAAAGVMYAYDRWGEPWRKRGEEFTKRKNP